MSDSTRRISFAKTEWWPIYVPADPLDPGTEPGVFDVPRALLDEWDAAVEEFERIQAEFVSVRFNTEPHA